MDRNESAGVREATGSRDAARKAKAESLMDAENLKDPRRAFDGQTMQPFEWLYARRVLAWIQRLNPDASDELLLAARCQHICRWMIPRDRYPMNLNGYLEWRETLKQFHADKAATILQHSGYTQPFIARVRSLVTKELFPDDPESRILEDALCLVFLETQLEDMMASKPESKLADILHKTWAKMTPAARQIALKLELSQHACTLLKRATEREPAS